MLVGVVGVYAGDCPFAGSSDPAWHESMEMSVHNIIRGNHDCDDVMLCGVAIAPMFLHPTTDFDQRTVPT